MLVRIALVLAAIAVSGAHSLDSSTHVIKEAFAAPLGWRIDSLPDPDHVLDLRVGLRQSNWPELERQLSETSDPDHPRYGQHLSKEAIEDLISPTADSLEAVLDWLKDYGVMGDSLSFSPARDWVRVKLPLHVVEEMLGTTYHVWRHDEGRYAIRTTEYSLPKDLHAHVDLVQPTTHFGGISALKSSLFREFTPLEGGAKAEVDSIAADEIDASCNETITVDCLAQLYNFADYTPSFPNNSVAVTGYLEEFPNATDLQIFYADQVPKAAGSSFTFVDIPGNNQTSGEDDQHGVEANLDVQFAFGISYPINASFLYTHGRPPAQLPDGEENFNEPYADFLDYILAQDTIPWVISTSYAEGEQSVPFSYAERVCRGFAQLGARGVTVLFSSGDGGVGGPSEGCTRFRPLFPPSCPYVTAVGGTVNIPEVAVDFSGGGFSDYFARPSWQDDVVPAYIEKVSETYDSYFNKSGRGIPDISAQADNYRVFYQGKAGHVGGTSASAPAVGGILALVNDVRLAKGLPTLGFLNPLLYKQNVGSLFNDITEGNNPACGTDGFNATEGWDPVTGFGTPNFALLRELN
ncbi:tripeptidyl peptidase A [Cylindrobasidium torrendii FP15055 ss-10]|uniref:tripeptidyl-peptidase II n=1 Tax=Cylindrobasidium torrendii FP15055 ss-10 TaxID=1314674 RepID=A0A0D7BUC7_9AGAR|nr:tripeptidyl peptidase A [Cylindrobasidium torrendii FP15055 ss-10]